MMKKKWDAVLDAINQFIDSNNFNDPEAEFTKVAFYFEERYGITLAKFKKTLSYYEHNVHKVRQVVGPNLDAIKNWIKLETRIWRIVMQQRNLSNKYNRQPLYTPRFLEYKANYQTERARTMNLS